VSASYATPPGSDAVFVPVSGGPDTSGRPGYSLRSLRDRKMYDWSFVIGHWRSAKLPCLRP
ncbi:MAG: hypothetical protein WD708_08090, partial [Kiritimatiellia bacterium]